MQMDEGGDNGKNQDCEDIEEIFSNTLEKA